jgi:hypothetical protein
MVSGSREEERRDMRLVYVPVGGSRSELQWLMKVGDRVAA